MKLNRKVFIPILLVALIIIMGITQASNIKRMYLNIIKKPDENGMYTYNDNYFKSIYPLNDKSVLRFSNKLNTLYDTFLSDDMNVYYAIIPDKTYYDKDSMYKTLDYDKMIEMLNQNIDNIEYIDLKDSLNLNDYFKTDNHWKQDKIFDALNKLGETLGFTIDKSNFEENSYDSFVGMYKNYINDSKVKEELVYMFNKYIDNAFVDNYQNNDFHSIYDVEKLNSEIPYDIYLSGATPFVTVTNKLAKTDKELIIFRDSFSSSLTPLIISEYSKITLIDLRYMMSTVLNDFIEFDNQDVLFLYSSAVVNNSTMLK
ncbi:hypothetical protein JYG23_03130 [Sedimentibacter sp. zth1]|uniref:DHHW family protein n=1 Tax=Sedimentibacter sp. zth1 TaxID=2816908 RepID=UPI001A92E6DA|nr:DHHW family protein [Sedimentibacter sp. zth1]QSX06466.1 hypothetical protein JYG23_03130 [Sedimentibacter sp. zth1]